jgi:hypothetical protein
MKWSPSMVGMFHYSYYWNSISLILEVKVYPNGIVDYVRERDQDGSIRVHFTALGERDRVFALV